MSTKRKVEALDAPAAAEEHVDKKAKPEMKWICLGPEELCDVHVIQDDLFGIKCAQMDIRRLKPAQVNVEPLLCALLDEAKIDSKNVAPFKVHLPPGLFPTVERLEQFFSFSCGIVSTLKGVSVVYAREHCHMAHALNVEYSSMLNFLAENASELPPLDAIHLGKLYKRPDMETVGMRALAKPGTVIPDRLKDECLKEWAPSVDTLDAIKRTVEAHLETKRTQMIWGSGEYNSNNYHGDTNRLVGAIFNLLKLPTC